MASILRVVETDVFSRIATLNPEFLLRAREDATFRKNLNQADLHTIDGGGLRLVFWRWNVPWGGRVTGGEIVDMLCREADQKHVQVGIVTRDDGLSSMGDILDALNERYPKATFEGVVVPLRQKIVFSGLPEEQQLSLKRCRILFSSLGAPEQEYFTESLRRDPGDIRVAVGVGGVFDVFTGKMQKTPRWMSFFGLEWLWRLLWQPRRFRRIFRAVIVFPWLVL